MQEVGETTQAILEDDEKQIEKILQANKGKTDPYWIVLFATPSKTLVDGKPTLMKVIKPYESKPKSQVGMVIGEVDNQKGKITWEVNMPDKPFGFEALGVSEDGNVGYETSIPNAYLYG